MADFSRPEYAGYVALCRDLRLAHEWRYGEWFWYENPKYPLHTWRRAGDPRGSRSALRCRHRRGEGAGAEEVTERTERIAPVAPRYAWVTVGDQVFSRCRGCGEVLKKPDGSPMLQRSWHDRATHPCLDDYLAARSARGLRDVIFRRDHGRCAGCGRECAELYRNRWRNIYPWAADHRQPLWAGGSRSIANVQTLCEDCHKAKTAREAAARAASRQTATLERLGLLPLQLRLPEPP